MTRLYSRSAIACKAGTMVPCIPPAVKLDHVSLAWPGSKGQCGGCSRRAQTVPAMAQADHAPCQVVGCRDARTKSEAMSLVERLHWASEMAPNEHPEIRSLGRGSRDVSAGLSQGRGWHTALCRGSAGKEPELRGRTEGLEANGRCLTGGEVAGAAPAPPAHGTPVALSGGGRTSHQCASTSTAQEAKLDTPTCSSQDLMAQPRPRHVPRAAPAPSRSLSHGPRGFRHCRLCKISGGKDRQISHSFRQVLVVLYILASLQDIMSMQRMLQTQKAALQNKRLAEKQAVKKKAN